MKAKRLKPKFPTVTETDVDRAIRKTATINMRLTQDEKDSLRDAAGALDLTMTEYLLKCHAAVAKHLGHDNLK